MTTKAKGILTSELPTTEELESAYPKYTPYVTQEDVDLSFDKLINEIRKEQEESGLLMIIPDHLYRDTATNQEYKKRKHQITGWNNNPVIDIYMLTN